MINDFLFLCSNLEFIYSINFYVLISRINQKCYANILTFYVVLQRNWNWLKSISSIKRKNISQLNIVKISI